jgi:hypothetical protein
MKLSRLPLASVTRRSRARIGALAAVVAIAAAVSTVVASPASAMWVDDHTFRNGETGRCIAYPGWGEGVFASTNCSNQDTDWIITHWNDGTAQLKHYRNQLGTDPICLDDSYAYGLRAFSCHPGWSPYSIYQSWYYVGAGEPNFLLKNQATGRCVDDSFAYGLRAFPCNGLTFQQWRYWD